MENMKLQREARRLKALLEHYEYGRMPKTPKHLTVEKTVSDRYFVAGKAELIDAELKIELDDSLKVSNLKFVMTNDRGATQYDISISAYGTTKIPEN